MNLQELSEHWDTFGREDPLWAILTKPGTEGNRWDLSEFLETGVVEIDAVIDHARRFCRDLANTSALDFGCGVGRLTQALCPHFERVSGVDISPAMLDRARELNQFGGRCRYILNTREDLKTLETESVDFVYSSRVLQHMEPSYSHRYLKEFARILRPGGILVFQLPAEPRPSSPATGPDASGVCYLAELRLVRTPKRIEPGACAHFELEVQNKGTGGWPQINLGNHWLLPDHFKSSRMLQFDDARSPLPPGLQAGKSVRIGIDVNSPQQPGQYLLEFDLVHEQVCWFKERGSPTIVVPVTIGQQGASQTTSKQPVTFEARMEMYGTPQAEVVALLNKFGMALLDIEPDIAAGAEWIGYRYYYRKQPNKL